MDKIIPYGRQNINQIDIDNVISVLKSDFLTQGPVVSIFEKELASFAKSKYAVAVNSATSALHIACLSLGLKKGDILWTSPISFVASSNCALYCGADVDFVDIDPKTYNMSVLELEKKLIKAKRLNKLPKIVIPVHLAGQSCDMEAIHALSKKFDFKIIEDASHAIGGKYKGRNIGNCTYSDITIFSFHPVKIITTGEGGAILTNDELLYGKSQQLRSHGITRNPIEMSKPIDGPWYYEQLDLGFNYRITDLQAALGISQLKRINLFVRKRQKIARLYNKLLNNSKLILPYQNKETKSSFHLYIIRVPSESNFVRRELFERLRANGILVNLHYIPIYKHPYYQSRYKIDESNFPQSEKYYEEAISLPIYYDLKEAEIFKIVKILNTPVNHQTIF
jgi:UDP-4-amino-4,6-dideoxy-N-acetyl-beta-L-altrosamine transaminase